WPSCALLPHELQTGIDSRSTRAIMSTDDDSIRHPLSGGEARRLIHEILSSGTITFTSHFEDEGAKDDIDTFDARRVLKGGVISDPAEFENGSWRYRIYSGSIWLVVAFRF